ncbi:MAG: hypothetical protein ACRD2T_08575, partial [Thermoanaerobaculia bacterium]
MPLPDGTCPSCREDTLARAGSDAGGTATAGRQEIVVEARRARALGDLIVMTIFCGSLVPAILGVKPDPGVFFLLVLLAPIYLSIVRWVIWPPRIVVREGKFSIRTIGPELTCPPSNVASISLAGKKLLVRFASLDLVDPKQRWAALEKELEKRGVHLAFGGGFFSREQIDRVCRALG